MNEWQEKKLKKPPYDTQRAPFYTSHGQHREKFGQKSEYETLTQQFERNIQRLKRVDRLCAQLVETVIEPHLTEDVCHALIKICLSYKRRVKTHTGSHHAFVTPLLLPQSVHNSDIERIGYRLAFIIQALHQYFDDGSKPSK